MIALLDTQHTWEVEIHGICTIQCLAEDHIGAISHAWWYATNVLQVDVAPCDQSGYTVSAMRLDKGM